MKKTLLLLAFLLIALTNISAQQIAKLDTTTIFDLQYVPPESLAVGQDNSPFLGDTVVVEGVVAVPPRTFYIGARWTIILVDENGGPWNAVQIVQHDTTQLGTNMSALKKGYKVRITGSVSEYSYSVAPSQTQIDLFTSPPVPVELLGYNYPVPEPMVVNCADLAQEVGEKYESALVMIKNVTVVNNAIPGNDMLIADATGQVVVDSWSIGLYDSLDTGTYSYPSNGTTIDIIGHIRSNPYGTGLNIGPRTSADIRIYTIPPVISDVVRIPAAPKSNEDVSVTAKIMDSNGTVGQAQIFFKVGTDAWTSIDMASSDTIFTGTIPKQADGSMVQYFIKAVDNSGDFALNPGDTSSSKYFYHVRDNGLTIWDLQWTPFVDGNSAYLGMEVTVSGVVTASPDDILGDYIIQEGEAPWNGIWVNDALHFPQRGDFVRVSGVVEENYNVTRLNLVTTMDSLGTGYTIDPLPITTGQATTGSPEAESYEGVLLQFDNVIVSNPFPDSPSNYGEIEINDGTGGYRVDENGTFTGNFDSTFALNDKIDRIIGIGWYSFYNYKLEPRGEDDVIGHRPSAVGERQHHLNLTYDLSQNYPNPFNPATTIHFSLGKNEFVELEVYNILGQKIRTLVHEYKYAGQHTIHWDGLDNNGKNIASGLYFYTIKAGNFIKTNKMVLLR